MIERSEYIVWEEFSGFFISNPHDISTFKRDYTEKLNQACLNLFSISNFDEVCVTFVGIEDLIQLYTYSFRSSSKKPVDIQDLSVDMRYNIINMEIDQIIVFDESEGTTFNLAYKVNKSVSLLLNDTKRSLQQAKDEGLFESLDHIKPEIEDIILNLKEALVYYGYK